MHLLQRRAAVPQAATAGVRTPGGDGSGTDTASEEEASDDSAASAAETAWHTQLHGNESDQTIPWPHTAPGVVAHAPFADVDVATGWVSLVAHATDKIK